MPPAVVPRAGVTNDIRDEDGEPPTSRSPGPENEEPKPPAPDRLFPGAGRVAVTVSSGIPHAALGDINVGVSPWFSMDLGATLSAKFNETSLFVRPRFALGTGRWFDVAYHMPIAYYPKSERRHGWDWWLINPALFLRVRPRDGTSFYGGMGIVAASTTDSLSAAFRDPEPAEPPENWDFSDVGDEEAHLTVNGVWNTFHLGIDQALTQDWIASIDSILLMDGLSLSRSYAEKVGPPVFVQAGITYVF